MSLTKTMPKPSPQYIPVDVDSMPKLPSSIRDINPEQVDAYESQMRIFWISLIDSVNSVIEKVES